MTDAAPLPLSSRTRVALAIARGIAASRGDENLLPDHVALGLLREGENFGVAALVHADVDLRTLRQALESGLDPVGRPRVDEVALPSTQGERDVLERALQEVRQRGDPYLGPQHLLLALLRDADGAVARACGAVGVTYDVASAAVARLVDARSNDDHRVDDDRPPSPPPE